MILVTLFPIIGPVLLFFSVLGLAWSVPALITGHFSVFGVLTFLYFAASIYAIGQLFSLSCHFVRHPHTNPERRTLLHNVIGLIAGYVCFICLVMFGNPITSLALFACGPLAVLAAYFLIVIWRQRRAA